MKSDIREPNLRGYSAEDESVEVIGFHPFSVRSEEHETGGILASAWRRRSSSSTASAAATRRFDFRDFGGPIRHSHFWTPSETFVLETALLTTSSLFVQSTSVYCSARIRFVEDQ